MDHKIVPMPNVYELVTGTVGQAGLGVKQPQVIAQTLAAFRICNQTRGTTRWAGVPGDVRAWDFSCSNRTAHTLIRSIITSNRLAVFNWRSYTRQLVFSVS